MAGVSQEIFATLDRGRILNEFLKFENPRLEGFIFSLNGLIRGLKRCNFCFQFRDGLFGRFLKNRMIFRDEVKELIKETAKRFNLNDWAMGWLTFGIDKWSIISAIIASGAYYMQNNVDPQYHALIAYSAVAWSTLILVFFLYNKAKK
jgi:hypothetical protein